MKNRHSIFSTPCIYAMALLLAIALYAGLGNYRQTIAWYGHGKTHYELLMTYQQLGGIDGMIQRIQQHLASHPNDEQGQTILKKLQQIKASQHS